MVVAADPLSSLTLQAINSWIELRTEQARFRTSRPSMNRLGGVLQLIGLPYEGEQQFIRMNEGPSTRSVHFIYQVDSTPIHGVQGAPLFGSQAHGTYNIFCLWEDARPDRVRLNSAIRGLAQSGEDPILILYLSALTDSERQEIRRHAWEQGITVLVLDEILFESFARIVQSEQLQPQDRFRQFLALTLPYTGGNPYHGETTGWGAGVPQEMFYGRQELSRSLMRMSGGTSIVFGGRQLGKTALLRHVEKAFSQPDEGKHAWFIDLKDRGYVATAAQEGAKESTYIFEIVHEKFREAGLLTGNAPQGNVDLIRQDIRMAFSNDNQLAVLIMFDESDAFLSADSLAGSPAIETFRSLMNETSNRLKVVFAGLHNVQRFAGKPNNPFPNLGFNPNRPRRGGIGPLTDHDARRLVEEPTYLMGFRFEPLAVDKVLSYTNRHPSLIQFFCHEVVDSWRREHPDQRPPYLITVSEIDKVYRLRSIQEGIKRRFEETFRLDPRYHVISLAIICYQDRPTRRWTLDEIRDCCQLHCPLTFDPEYLDALELSSLLNELIGLGILIEDNGAYRMRTSLIPQMFGTKGQIENILEDLGASEPFDVSVI